jgi:hypothetical protein
LGAVESLSVSGLGHLVISNLAHYVRGRLAPCPLKDWFAPFDCSYSLRPLIKALLESTSSHDTVRPDAPLAFHALGTENALRLVLAAALRSARAAAGFGRAAWARERQIEEAHAASVAQAWAKLALNDHHKPEPNFWASACTPLAAVCTTTDDDWVAPSTNGVNAAVAEVCDQFVASFVEAGGVALLVEVVERECAESQTTTRCDGRRIALTLARVEELYEARYRYRGRGVGRRSAPNWSWYELQLRWERQRKIALLAAALLRTLVAAKRDDDNDMEIGRHVDGSTIAQLTSVEPGPGMDRLLASARSLHALGHTGAVAAAWEDDVGLRPYLDLRRAKQGTLPLPSLRRRGLLV